MENQCDESVACTEQQQAQEIARLLSLFEESLAGDNLAEAEVLAKRIIELSISIDGRESTASANALTLLAVVQHEQEQYLTATQNFHAAISTLERVESMLSPDLIRPLQGLGETELAMGEPGRARSTFLRAIHISHVNDGPQNIHQVETLNSISEVDRRIGNYKDALETQKNVLAIHERATQGESTGIDTGIAASRGVDAPAQLAESGTQYLFAYAGNTRGTPRQGRPGAGAYPSCSGNIGS